MIFEKVKKLVIKELGVKADEVSLETNLVDDLGADSLDAVELIMALEEEFGIEVNDEEAKSIKTVADIINLVEAKK